jgi:uncharacterized membrane protein
MSGILGMSLPDELSHAWEDLKMRVATTGHALFAVILIALGVLGLIQNDYAAVWQPLPKDLPAREFLGYLCSLLTFACGMGLMFRRTAAVASRVLLMWLLLWMLLLNLPAAFPAPAALVSWYSCAEAAVMVAAAWVLYAWFASSWDTRHLAFATGVGGLRIGRALYGLALMFFGAAHFVYLQPTVADVPSWLPFRVAWAYFTGSTFIAAGLGVLSGIQARWAATLSTLQIGLFVLLVWIPLIVAPGHMSAFHWSETIISAAVVAGAWVVADSYRRYPNGQGST